MGTDGERAAGRESGRPASVDDDVWIGRRAVLDPWVSVGHRSVVASGAVVTDDVPDDVVVRGDPATVVRDLDWSCGTAGRRDGRTDRRPEAIYSSIVY